jgi:dihydroorotate dehydrogenase
LLGLGFGFVEIGSRDAAARRRAIRARACSGWRRDEGVVNRMGFNNDGGARVVVRRLARAARRGEGGGIVGVNVGANKDSADRSGRLRRADRSHSRRWRAISPSTFPRPTRRACAICNRPMRWMICSRAWWRARDEACASLGHRPVLLKIAPDLTLRRAR